MKRKITKSVKVGGVTIGGGAPISVQSMTNTDTRDIQTTVAQIKSLEKVGCEIVRVAVPDQEAATALQQIKAQITIPLVADIHFDYQLALTAINNGVDALRINPGNIGSAAKVEKVVKAAAEKGIPIRIGVNAGSLEKDLLQKYYDAIPQAMVESAMRHIAILENNNFEDIIISLKASDVQTTIEAYRLISAQVNYPLHIGITEAGTAWSGAIKSAIGISALLLQGIGDTVRVSLTAAPELEVRTAYEILKTIGLREYGPTFVSCPTCGRCEIDLINIAHEVETRLSNLALPLKIAIMGCVVNGPGEAREADLGIAGGKGYGLIFRKGEIIKKVKEEELVDALLLEVEKIINNRKD